MLQPKSSNATTVLSLLVVYRLVNALCVRTFFQPDEYFQALEPAWRIAFGPQSGAWLTWEWQHQLRSSLHPALFGGVYVAVHHVTQLLSLRPQLAAAVFVAAPEAVQAVFAAFGDYYTWQLAGEVYGSSGNIAGAALWMTVLNPWQWYCSTRTFSNSIETTLTVMALYHWPWSLVGDARESRRDTGQGLSHAQNLRLSLLLAAIAVVLRPTNLLIWLAILTMTVTRLTLDGESPLTQAALVELASEIMLCGCAILGVSVLADRFYFGFWAFPPYKWLHFNITQSLAVFYGRNDWHYYLSQGLPLLSTTVLPFVILGLYRSTGTSVPSGPTSKFSQNAARTLAFAVLATIGALSTISHKEVRFVYPLLPILHVLAAPHFAAFYITAPLASPSTSTSSGELQKPKQKQPNEILHSPKLQRKPLLALAITANVVLAGYLSLFHQGAPLSVLSFLRGEYQHIRPDHLTLQTRQTAAPLAPTGTGTGAIGNADEAELFALFLMPCHSTPWRSHLVYPSLRARALTCEPPLNTAPGTREREEYVDEADRFYADTAGFLAREMWPIQSTAAATNYGVPRYIVGFEGIEESLSRFFDDASGPGKTLGVKLRRVWEGWNGFFNEDWRRSGLLVVWGTGVHEDPTNVGM